MNKITRFAVFVSFLSVLAAFPVGCSEDGAGGGSDLGDNDRNLVVCLGDSITHGEGCDGQPYPPRLAAMSGKRVLNCGAGGTTTSHAASVVSSALARKPGFVCILYGANDCIRGVDKEKSIENLRYAVRACRANKSKVIIATPTPMVGSHAIFEGRTADLAAAIRLMALQEGVTCIDLHAAFGSGVGLLNSDGLHPTEAGSDFIARKFNSKM